MKQHAQRLYEGLSTMLVAGMMDAIDCIEKDAQKRLENLAAEASSNIPS